MHNDIKSILVGIVIFAVVAAPFVLLIFIKSPKTEPRYNGPIITCEQVITKMPVSNWHHSQEDKWTFINADKTKIYQTDFHCIIEDQYSPAK